LAAELVAMLNNRRVARSKQQWLDEEQQQAWIALVHLMIRLPAVLDAQLRRDAEMSHFEYQILAALSMAPGRSMRMSDLATITEGSLARLSQASGRLERRGWLRRTPDPDDGRCTLAILSDAGETKVHDAAPGHVHAVREIVFASLSRTQIRQLTTTAHRVLETIERLDDAGSSPM
jgi:DNA-binding MarR family transcriptional regulator